MRVDIGPYLKWWGPHQIADLLKKVGVSEDRCDKVGEWLASKQWLVDLCNWSYSKRKRKVKVHIDNYDVWNMDKTLAMVIHPTLKKLKEVKHGYPSTDWSDGPLNFTPAESEDDHIWNKERWEYILDEMIYAFECLADDDWEDQFYTGGYETMDKEKYAEAQKRIKNGLRLFGKYYQNLWD